MAIPKSKPRQTGPKSDIGKKKSSSNALQHGALANRAQLPSTSELVQSYEAEMHAHYSSNNPLVKLQIQRIATTRAKLSQLYELEQARMEIIYKEFDENPKHVFESIKDAEELAANFAKSLIEHGSYELPFGLQPEQVKAIAIEIQMLKRPALTHEDFDLNLPVFCQIAKSLNLGWMQDVSHPYNNLELLKKIGVNFKIMFELKSATYARIKSSFEEYIEKSKKWDAISSDWTEENETNIYSKKQINQDDQLTPEQIKEYLKYFIYFDSALDKVDDILDRFKQQKELMRATLSFPTEESDRFSRYQTSLERRLSTQIGELRLMLMT